MYIIIINSINYFPDIILCLHYILRIARMTKKRERGRKEHKSKWKTNERTGGRRNYDEKRKKKKEIKLPDGEAALIGEVSRSLTKLRTILGLIVCPSQMG